MDINKQILSDNEGKLFLHRWLNSFSPDSFFLAQDYYTIKNGDLYIIEDDKLTLIDEETNLIFLISKSDELGLFDENNKPSRIKSINFSFSDIEKLGEKPQRTETEKLEVLASMCTKHKVSFSGVESNAILEAMDEWKNKQIKK